MSTTSLKIDTSRFYQEWKGHPVDDLKKFRDITLKLRPGKPVIYLAGDSSLDNKYWVFNSGLETSLRIPEIYDHAFNRPKPKPDVAFWVNYLLGGGATCINAAIEESMLRERDAELLPQDKFIRDNISKEDILIVSVGANDVVLHPTFSTTRHMLRLTWLTRRMSVESGTASSLSYFKYLFGTKLQKYITQLTSVTKPRAVIVCMIYYPLEAQHEQSSWADFSLKMIGYNSNPNRLQTAMKKIYKIATCDVKVEGTQVVPCALYEVLDGTRKSDYTARVEPSKTGGRRIAMVLARLVIKILKQKVSRDAPLESSRSFEAGLSK